MLGILPSYKRKQSSAKVKSRAKQIAIEQHGESDWNKAGSPKKKIVLNEYGFLDIYDALRNYGPLYALYGYYIDGKREGGHYVVITGANLLTGEIYINNPNFKQGTQSYKEFLDGYYGGSPINWEFQAYYYPYF